MKVISGSINLSKIPKERIKRTDKNGAPFSNGAQYLDVTILVNDQSDKFGNDVSIIVGQTKEEREAKEAKTYLGNAKVVWSSDKQEPQREAKEPQREDPFHVKDKESGLPF